MTRSLACLALLLASCLTTEQGLRSDEASTLVSLVKLPPLPFDPPASELRLVFLLGVQPDGIVREVRLLTPTRYDAWDAGAVDSVRKWRYAPFTADSGVTLRWIRNTVVVRLEKPTLLNLGVINTASRAESDSLHALLRQGASFDTLARIASKGQSPPSSWFFPSLDISCCPPHIREIVAKLRVSEFTRPLPLGDRFVIYKRFDEDFTPATEH